MAKKGSVQKRIRDLERALRKKSANDPSTAKLHQMIKDLKEEKVQNIVKIKEKKNSQKYHMVKFFERKKVTRHISKLEKQIAKRKSQAEDTTDLETKKTALEKDLAYIMYFPKDSKYISILVDKNGGQKDEKTLLQIKKARAVALRAWENSVNSGAEDRVAYAMEVERNGNSTAAGATKNQRKLHQENTRNENRFIDDMDEKGDSNESGSDSEDSSNDGNSSDSESSGSDSETDQNVIEDDTKHQEDIGTSDVINNGDANDINSYELDPFFLEEDDGMNTHEIQEEIIKSIHPRKTHKGNAAGKGGKGRAGNAMRRVPGKEMTKQEARLAKWQSKQVKSNDAEGKDSNKRKFGNVSHDSSVNNSQWVTGSKGADGVAAMRNAKGGGYGGRGGGKGGRKEAGKGGGGRGGKGIKGSGGRGHIDRGSTVPAPKAAWEEGGGISAKYVTAMSQSKLSGGIVAGSSNNKKIKFD